MPTPDPGESRDDFVARCIPEVLEDGTAEDGQQAVAVCNSLYEQANEATMNKQVDYKALPGFETKTIPTFVKEVDEARGIVEHIVSVFGIIDDGRDIVMPGSFAKTIAEHGSRVRVLDQHNYRSALDVVGRPLSLREIGRDELPLEVTARYPEATGGLLATTQYALDTDNGRNMFNLVAGNFLPETSIGYDALDTEEEFREIDGEKVAVRLLKTIRLWEYSNVIWGMNPATSVVSAKATDPDTTAPTDDAEQKVVSGATDLPIADRDRAWDSAEAIQGIRRVTGSDEEPSDSYKDGFFWYDGEAPEMFGSYKLAFADDVGGELTAIPRGIFAVAAVLEGARGGVDIPEADQEQIRRRVSRYYARMREQFDDDNIVPPWEKAKAAKELGSDGRPIRRLGDTLTGLIHRVFTMFADDMIIAGFLTQEQRIGLSAAIGDALDALNSGMPEGVADIRLDSMTDEPMARMGRLLNSEAKVGRAISAARMERIRGAINNVQAALSDLEAMLAEVEPVAEDADKQMAAPQEGAADDSDVDEAGPVEPPTSEADRLRTLQLFKLKAQQYPSLEV